MAALALSPITSSADEERAHPEDRKDPLFITGTALGASGLGASVLGIVMLGTASGDRICGVTGCIDTRNMAAERRSGAFVGAGIGMASVALPTVLATLASSSPPKPRTSEPRMVAGAVLTDLGVGLIGASIGFRVGDRRQFNDDLVPIGLGISAGALLAIGIPLWATGQRSPSPAMQMPFMPPPAPAHYAYAEREALKGRRDDARALEITGIVFTAVGTGGLVGGLIHMAAVDTHGDFGGFNMVPGLIVAGVSILCFLGPGIPLWVVGARRRAKLSEPLTTWPKPAPNPRPAEPDQWIQSVSVRTNGTGIVIDGSF